MCLLWKEFQSERRNDKRGKIMKYEDMKTVGELEQFRKFNEGMMRKFRLLKRRIKEELKKPAKEQDWDKLSEEMFKVGVFT